jgi:hypothetical protein
MSVDPVQPPPYYDLTDYMQYDTEQYDFASGPRESSHIIEDPAEATQPTQYVQAKYFASLALGWEHHTLFHQTNGRLS